ncbi:sugar ABC transporter permease [Frankia sp. AgPm24]|uniref:carbohydrate ABC transporter permease n=1 Tax=Frankia sp. AgPm24 TaxID=631128 RepID=UPI00200F5CC8|nr:sugar ABC transporter permease [Frankia sp. AgPm24]MCK9923620.1 sugar ABC transporter permease [Frankia sp. AgPm24]
MFVEVAPPTRLVPALPPNAGTSTTRPSHGSDTAATGAAGTGVAAASGAADASPAPRDRRSAGSLARLLGRGIVPYLYLAPALGMLVVWIYRPLIQTANYSFYSWNLSPDQPAIPQGWHNYHRLFTLPEVGSSVLRTISMIALLLPFTIIIPIIVGLLTAEVRGRARTLYQALIFAPFLVAPVASAAVWQWMLTPDSGIVNRATGLKTNWLHERLPALLSITGIAGWQMLGFAVLVVSAGLASINGDYSEAASVDGASRWQSTRWLTLPLLSPTLVFLVLTTVLLAGTWTFPLIDTLTQGGPVSATTNIYYLLWQYGFKSFDAGFAAAAGVIFFAGFTLVAAFLVWLSDRLTFHDN